MLRLFRKSQTTIEYAMLIGIIVAALIGMSMYLRISIAGRWRQAGDVFGHGRLYQANETVANTKFLVRISYFHGGDALGSHDRLMNAEGETGHCKSNFVKWCSYGSPSYCTSDWRRLWGSLPSGVIHSDWTYTVQWSVLEAPPGAVGYQEFGNFSLSLHTLWGCPVCSQW